MPNIKRIGVLIDDQTPEDPEDLELASIDIPSDGYSPGLTYWIEVHLLNITYGIKHETTVPASEL
jgi:hypothetical protein